MYARLSKKERGLIRAYIGKMTGLSPAQITDARGKRHRRYKAEDHATPYEKLKALPEAAQCLKPEISFRGVARKLVPMASRSWCGIPIIAS